MPRKRFSMFSHERHRVRSRWVVALWTALTLAAGCSASVGEGVGPGGATGGASPSGNGKGGSGSTAGGGNPGTGNSGTGNNSGTGATGNAVGSGGGGNSSTNCQGEVVPEAKRIVRLSFNQISVSVHALFGATLGNQIDQSALIGQASPVARTFPPLASAQEGGSIIQKHWQTIDGIATSVGAYVAANLATIAGGTAPTTDAAAQTFVTTLAQKVYRRPLLAAESQSLLQVYSEVKAVYGTIPDAIQHSVAALMQAPAFLYRTELGTGKGVAGPLSHYEMASQLSYFLTDGPPDPMLLSAAAGSKLGTAEEIRAHATRILATPSARTNLGEAMFSYFALDSLSIVQISDPGWTFGTMANPYSGTRESAYREAELFLTNNLWSEPLTALLTSKQTRINKALAPLYGVTTFPPAGVTPDTDGFALVTLPGKRSGLLTQVAFLAARSRPDLPSVVGRGKAVNAALLCAVNPPFPEDPTVLTQIEDAKATLVNATERERADYRAKTPLCGACHLNFDAYGLALENYDIIGRYRTADPQGRPIDASVTLPAGAGSQMAADAVDMATKIAATPGFTNCVAKNMINWALAEGSQLTPTSCSTQSVASAFTGTDKTFSALMREIAASQAFSNRTAGVN